MTPAVRTGGIAGVHDLPEIASDGTARITEVPAPSPPWTALPPFPGGHAVATRRAPR
ncbi:MAG: hypothetical protein ACJ74O_01345 [Frankiaceae bacterium]